jgi:DNA-directed RNA polymerase specialized sigma24 family protein
MNIHLVALHISCRISGMGGDRMEEMSDTDLQLLARYSRERSEDAFSELVRRHVDLVYSAALRQVRSPQLAEEVSQSAFADLARNAGRLGHGGGGSSPGSLVGWLHTVTRRSAIDVVRREASHSSMKLYRHSTTLIVPLCCSATSRTNPCAKSAHNSA